MKITSLCMNPCIDRTVACPVFDVSSANRVHFIRDDIGGKGVNTAVQAARLGGESALVLPVPGEDREGIRSLLLGEGVAFREVPVPSRLRVNLKIRVQSGDTVEINEEGAPAGADLEQKCAALTKQTAQKGTWCLLTGSLPPGIGDGFYRDLARSLEGAGVFTAVDADGAPLKKALEARPRLIKPNRQEFARLTGLYPASPEECCRSCRRLIADFGVGAVCLTLGGEGAVYVSPREALYAPALKVPVLSLHGAGDSLLSALCLALSEGRSPADALALGTAAAAATVSLPGTGMASREEALSLLSGVRVIPVEV